MKKRLLVLAIACLSLGLVACGGGLEPEDSVPPQQTSEKPSEAAPSSNAPSANPTSEKASEAPQSSEVPAVSSEEVSKGYDYNEVTSETNLVIAIFDKYVENAEGEGYTKTYTNALVEAYIDSLGAETTVRIGVIHLGSADVASFAEAINTSTTPVDIIIGSGANIYTNASGAVTVSVSSEKAALKDTITIAKTGRQAALLTENDNAIALYKYLTDVDYVKLADRNTDPVTPVDPEPGTDTKDQTKIFVMAAWGRFITEETANALGEGFKAYCAANTITCEEVKVNYYEGKTNGTGYYKIADLTAAIVANTEYVADVVLPCGTNMKDQANMTVVGAKEDMLKLSTVEGDATRYCAQLNEDDLTKAFITYVQTEDAQNILLGAK